MAEYIVGEMYNRSGDHVIAIKHATTCGGYDGSGICRIARYPCAGPLTWIKYGQIQSACGKLNERLNFKHIPNRNLYTNTRW